MPQPRTLETVVSQLDVTMLDGDVYDANKSKPVAHVRRQFKTAKYLQMKKPFERSIVVGDSRRLASTIYIVIQDAESS